MPSLQSLRVQRFKTISDAPFDLGPINLLVGANNSGKSTIIQALHFGVGVLQTIGLLGQWPANEDSAHTTSLTPNQLVYAPTEDVYSLGHNGRLREPREEAISISMTLEDGRTCNIDIRRGRNRNIAVSVDNVGVGKELSSLTEPFTIFSPGLAGVSKSEHYVSDGVLLRTIARGDANLVLRNTLLRLWGTTKWGAFLDDLREVFPAVDFQVNFDKDTDEHISVQVKTGDHWVPLELSGTGVLQATQILSYSHRYNPSVLVLDEPDSHLHPNNQRLLCALLQTLAEERNTQVLLTSHSRHVVDAIGTSARFLWVRDSAVERAGTDDEIGVLLDIGALDVKERVAHGSAKAVLLTEDERIRGLTALLESSGFDLEQTAILSYFGCTITKNLRPLLKIVREKNKTARIIVHKDRDFMTDDEAKEWEEELRRLHVEPYLTTGVDVESHFLKAAVLADLNTVLSEEQASVLLSKAIDETRDECIGKYVNGRTDIIRKAGGLASFDPGNLAVEAPKALTTDPHRYAHGKTVLRRVRQLFREEYGTELIAPRATPKANCDRLSVIAVKIFGKKKIDGTKIDKKTDGAKTDKKKADKTKESKTHSGKTHLRRGRTRLTGR